MPRNWDGPTDAELVGMLREMGEDKDQIRDGKHQANDHMMAEGWLTQRDINKFVKKYPEEGGEEVEVTE